MNFKPTILKTVISISAGVAVHIYIAGSIICDSPDGCVQAVWTDPLYFAIPFVIIVYVLWSLFQKKK